MRVNATLDTDTFPVHEPCHVGLTVRCSEDIPAGTEVQIQFPQSWSLVSGPSFTRLLQCEAPAAPHYVQVTGGQATVWQHTVESRTEHFPEGQHRHGRLVRAVLEQGTIPAGEALRILYTNTFAPFVAEEDTVYLRVGDSAPSEPVLLRTTPAAGESLRVLAPSAARPGEPFDVLIVSLDRFENASSTCFQDEILWLTDGSMAARDLSFRGRLRVPVTIDQEGVTRFRFQNCLSNAVRVQPDAQGPFWGDIHIHTKLSHDAQGTKPYDYARDVSGLDFAGVADHVQSLGETGYDQVLEWAREAYRPGTFVTMLADERNPTGLTGHHNLYFRDEDIFQKHRWIGAHAPKLPEDSGPLDPGRMMAIPHHTGIHFGGLRQHGPAGNAIRWDAYQDPAGLRPVMEIYSHHGQSEAYAPHHILAYEFNRMRNPERRGNTSVPGPHYAQDYWRQGLRIGVIGSSDEHSGQGGRRHGGLAAVFADELTREAVFDGIRARHCYATTGERILLDFSVDNVPMGESARRRKGDTVAIHLAVWGTCTLVRVEILRYRFGVDRDVLPVVAELPNPGRQGLDADVTVEDTVEEPCLYYARVLQEPLNWPGMAWTSPIWIDLE